MVNGRFVLGNTMTWGGSVNDAWWLGKTTPANALDAVRSITHFIPHHPGQGLTENLEEFIQEIINQGTPFYQSSLAWHDRRGDDHTIKKRKTSDVWAAFNVSLGAQRKRNSLGWVE